MSIYSSLVEVASLALGGGKDSNGKPKPTEDLSQASPEHFASRVTQMLSF